MLQIKAANLQETVDPSPVIIETVEAEEEKKENNDLSVEEIPPPAATVAKTVVVETEEAAPKRSPLANVSNEQSMVI